MSSSYHTPTGRVITRFAPSPTGHLHIGGARTALFCWAYAKSQGGRFMLRIEDTDAARSSDESARGIMEDLAWLGIEWDDGPNLTLSQPAAQAGGQVASGEGKNPPAGAGGSVRTIGANARDVGSYFQAQRKHIYNAEIERLVRIGRAYPGFEKAEDLDGKRKAAVAAKQTYRYERPTDIVPGVFNEARWVRASEGEPHVIRFLAPNEEIVVHDQVLGDVKLAAGELDDFVIRKADGFPTYHFAVVVDDETMGTTHVLRAQEHLANTPRHVAMQKALGYRVPVYGHMPLIFNMDGTKMSKRDKAKAARKAAKDAMAKDSSITAGHLALLAQLEEFQVHQFLAAESDDLRVAERLASYLHVTLPEVEVNDFRTAGYMPEAIVNFLGLLGWNPGVKTDDGKDLEKFDIDYLAKHFSLERIGRTNAKFDRKKLASFNFDYLNGLDDETYRTRWLNWQTKDASRFYTNALWLGDVLADQQRGQILSKAVRPRAKTFEEAARTCEFLVFIEDSVKFIPGAREKALLANNGEGRSLLAEFKPRLEALSDWTPVSITTALDTFANEKGMPNPGGIAQPLRVAVTGTGVSPGLGETLAVLGKESTLKRIVRCLDSVA